MFSLNFWHKGTKSRFEVSDLLYWNIVLRQFWEEVILLSIEEI